MYKFVDKMAVFAVFSRLHFRHATDKYTYINQFKKPSNKSKHFVKKSPLLSHFESYLLKLAKYLFILQKADGETANATSSS